MKMIWKYPWRSWNVPGQGSNELDDDGFEQYCEETLHYEVIRDEIRKFHMHEGDKCIGEGEQSDKDEHLAGVVYLSWMLDSMLELPSDADDSHSKPHTPYQQRVKSTLQSRLDQLRIKVEPEQQAKNDPNTATPMEKEHIDKREHNLPVSKCNQSRVGASFAKRLLILIRSHLRKKGL